MKFFVGYIDPDTREAKIEEFPKLKKAREFYVEILCKVDNRCNVTITDEKGKVWKHSKNYLRSIFDKDGNWKFKDQYGNPSWVSNDMKTRRALFDEDGRAIYDDKELKEFIIKNKCSPFSDIVKYYWSHMIDTSTKGFWHASCAF